MAYRYILRYLIDPGFEAGERIEELISFCNESKIEEVMLFLAAEELSAGHPTDAELDAFIRLAKTLKPCLAAAGIELSLNPWSTLYHSSRGRTLREGQRFRLMVGENGRESTVSPCPLCTEWRDYLAGSFARMAREINPVALWIEDDWRLRNHGAALGWGGCFCGEHLTRFSRRVGEPVSRERLLRAILAPGKPHPWRGLWLDLSRESLLEPLQFASARIREASPSTRVALMSGSPDTHAAEGRNWPSLQDAVRGQAVFLSRPTMKPYTQTHALGTPPGLTRLTIANLQGEIELYPELENSPRSGAYSKSRAYSIWQMLHCAAMGSAGITINHYDMLGNGISLDPAFGRALARFKPKLNALAELGLDDRNAQGACILFSPEISRHIQPENGMAAGMAGLSQISTVWGDSCFILGVAHHFSRTAGNAPVFVNQQTLRAFTDAEMARLLQGALILDAESAAILVERGFGAEAGIRGFSFQELETAAYAYEQIDARRFVMEGGPRFPRMTAQRCSPQLAVLEPVEEAEVLSTIRTADHRALFPGAILFRNARGGRVLTLAYPAQGKGQFFMAFFNVYRRAFLQKVLFEMAPGAPLACIENAPMQAYRSPTPSGTLLSAINPADDPVEQVVWAVETQAFENGDWHFLEADGRWRPVQAVQTARSRYSRTLLFDCPVAPLDGGFFHFRPRAVHCGQEHDLRFDDSRSGAYSNSLSR